jgi:hypothetical protein
VMRIGSQFELTGEMARRFPQCTVVAVPGPGDIAIAEVWPCEASPPQIKTSRDRLPCPKDDRRARVPAFRRFRGPERAAGTGNLDRSLRRDAVPE